MSNCPWPAVVCKTTEPDLSEFTPNKYFGSILIHNETCSKLTLITAKNSKNLFLIVYKNGSNDFDKIIFKMYKTHLAYIIMPFFINISPSKSITLL